MSAGEAVPLSAAGAAARRGDRDRFEAALFEDDAALRERLFTLIALNAELARARLRVSEPQLGLIRLQWWRDAVAEAAGGAPPRAHELAAPVSALVAAAPPAFSEALIALIEAWARELDPAPFESAAALDAFLNQTAGAMLRLGGLLTLERALAPEEAQALSAIGFADGAARALRAIGPLAAEGRAMLPLAGASLAALLRGAPDAAAGAAVQRLGAAGLAALRRGEAGLRRCERPIQARLKPITLASWRAGPTLRRAARGGGDPLRDFGPESPFRRRFSLLWRGLTGRF